MNDDEPFFDAEAVQFFSEGETPSLRALELDLEPEPDDAPSEATHAPPPAEARIARENARTLLEKGAGTDAIVAGRTSVALDPTDAEAWLVLGAAYQVVGNWQEARSAFQSCVRLAKRGPIAECRAL